MHESQDPYQQKLRQKAEDKAQSLGYSKSQTPSPEETRTLLHELRVHQIELEMQNEELQRAQQEIEASRSRYFHLYDMAPVGYLTISDKGLITEANLALAKMLGIDRSMLAKQRFSSFVLPEDQENYYHHIKRLLEPESPQSCEVRIKKTDGSPLWVRLEATYTESPDNAATCYMVVSNISRMKTAEESLIQHTQFSELISKIARDLISTDPDTIDQKLKLILEEAGRFFHADRSYIFQTPDQGKKLVKTHEWCDHGMGSRKEWLQGIPEDTYPWLMEQLHAKGWCIIDTMGTLPEKRTEKVPLHKEAIQSLLVVPLWDKKGHLIGVIGFDWVDRKTPWNPDIIPLLQVLAGVLSDAFRKSLLEIEWLEAKKQAQNANLTKSQFISNISHELRTPLNGVIGFAQLLSSSELTATQHEYLGYILSSAQNQLDLVNGILDFSKLEAGKLVIDPEPALVPEICDFSMDAVRPAAAIKGLALQRNLDPLLNQKVIIDGAKLRQALLNLLGNAVKFTETGSVSLTVVSKTLSSSPEDLLIHFSVSDTGIGISEAMLSKVGTEFFQVDGSIDHEKIRRHWIGIGYYAKNPRGDGLTSPH